jgi:type IX secretion system PorP/SprF family membrane protein
MKKIILSILMSIPGLLIYAQDLNINHHAFYRDGVNPGSFIHAPEVNIFVLYNNEFWGFREEPNTQILDVSVNLGGVNKLGLMVYNDIIGWDKAQNIKLRYARKFAISDRSSFSLGLSPGVIHKSLLATQMSFEQSGVVDPVSLYDRNHTVFDFDFGGEFRYDSLVVGLSTNHMTKSLTKYDSITPTPHYYAYAQYTTSGNVKFRPNVLFRYWKNTYWVEAGVLVFFNNPFWMGASYTIDHDLTCMAGLKILKNKNVNFGYAFKSNMNGQILRPGSTNSHEIFLNFSFGNGPGQFPLTVRNL